MNIQGSVIALIGGLIAVIVMISVIPMIFDFQNAIFGATDASRFTSMGQFGSILSLIVGFAPLLLIVGVMGAVAWFGFTKFKSGSMG